MSKKNKKGQAVDLAALMGGGSAADLPNGEFPSFLF
jgi:hypothetical protein